jgi:DNA-binding transcriptional ArsR family regulator
MIRIRLDDGRGQHIAFTYSPLLECVLSLHVLFAPKHHALLHDWVRRMRTLDPNLKRRIEAFAFLFHWHVPDMLLPGVEGPQAFESELARLLDHSPELLLEEFGRPLYDHGGRHGQGIYENAHVRETMLERAQTYGGESRRLAEGLLADPVRFARAFVSIVEDYWTSTFATEWERIEPRLSRSLRESKRLLETSGIWSVLGRLPSNCRADPSRHELHIDLPHEHTIEISASNPLVLSPSVFVWPHLRVNCDGPWPTALVYATPELTREAQPRIPPEELLRTLRALADDTRLRVLRLIAERPRTTQELAPLVGLSPAGLSKTLRRLSEAGLVTAHREGYYVVYNLASARVDEVSAALRTFLRGFPPPPT